MVIHLTIKTLGFQHLIIQSRGFKEKRGLDWSRDREIYRGLKPPGFQESAWRTILNIKSRGVDLPPPPPKGRGFCLISRTPNQIKPNPGGLRKRENLTGREIMKFIED
jgi:hypothetical protein